MLVEAVKDIFTWALPKHLPPVLPGFPLDIKLSEVSVRDEQVLNTAISTVIELADQFTG
jgi:hypothetical protein